MVARIWRDDLREPRWRGGVPKSPISIILLAAFLIVVGIIAAVDTSATMVAVGLAVWAIGLLSMAPDIRAYRKIST